jgi:hypothetical protein
MGRLKLTDKVEKIKIKGTERNKGIQKMQK